MNVFFSLYEAAKTQYGTDIVEVSFWNKSVTLVL